jgi:hypothetical protein
VLLVEIERHCADDRCRARNRVGLTKAEARAYRGFKCVRCERWHEDALAERDVPDWWEELTLTDLHALRPPTDEGTSHDAPSEVVARLSAAWHDSGAAETDGDVSETNGGAVETDGGGGRGAREL